MILSNCKIEYRSFRITHIISVLVVTRMVKIGLIGTGMLGEAVGLHLLKSGFSLCVYNRTKSKTKSLEEMVPLYLIHQSI